MSTGPRDRPWETQRAGVWALRRPLGALKCHVPSAISVGGVRRVRGLVAGAKQGRAEALRGRRGAGRAAFTAQAYSVISVSVWGSVEDKQNPTKLSLGWAPPPRRL